MTNVDTDDHDPFLLEDLGELGSDGLSVELGVDLLHKVGGVRKRHFAGGLPLHHLRQNAFPGVDILGHLVIFGATQDLDGENLRALERQRLAFNPAEDLLDAGLQRSLVIWQLENFDRSTFDADLPLALMESLDSMLGSVAVSLGANQEDEGLLQIVTLKNRHLLQEPLVDEELLVGSEVVLEFGNCKGATLKGLRIVFDLDVPFLPLTLLEQAVDHALNRLHFLRWILLYLGQEFPHLSWVASNGVWDAIEKTELGRKVGVLATLCDQEQGLVFLGDLEVVLLIIILSDAHLGAISDFEEGLRRSLVKEDVFDDVGSLGAIVGNDTRSSQSCSASGLEDAKSLFVSAALVVHDAVVDVIYVVEYGPSRHESCAVVKNKRATILILVGHSFESTPDLHIHTVNVDRF